jgi:hypothetical protein
MKEAGIGLRFNMLLKGAPAMGTNTKALALDMGGTHIGCGLVEGQRLPARTFESTCMDRVGKAPGACGHAGKSNSLARIDYASAGGYE